MQFIISYWKNEVNVRSTINLIFKKNKNDVSVKNVSYSDFMSKLENNSIPLLINFAFHLLFWPALPPYIQQVWHYGFLVSNLVCFFLLPFQHIAVSCKALLSHIWKCELPLQVQLKPACLAGSKMITCYGTLPGELC